MSENYVKRFIQRYSPPEYWVDVEVNPGELSVGLIQGVFRARYILREDVETIKHCAVAPRSSEFLKLESLEDAIEKIGDKLGVRCGDVESIKYSLRGYDLIISKEGECLLYKGYRREDSFIYDEDKIAEIVSLMCCPDVV